MKKMFNQFYRFFIVGASSAIIQFSVLMGLVEFLFINPILASTLGYLAGALFNYILNHYFTFKSTLKHRQAFIRFTINSLFGLLLNFLFMLFLLKYYPYLISQVITAFIILVWNFTIHRCWTFREMGRR